MSIERTVWMLDGTDDIFLVSKRPNKDGSFNVKIMTGVETYVAKHRLRIFSTLFVHDPKIETAVGFVRIGDF